jgi:two-component system NtrC family sensor kinase
VDLLLFTSSRGESFPAVIRDPSISDSALHTAVAPEVSRVLQSDDAVAEVVCVGDKLYDVVSVRAFNTDNKLQLGVLTLGTEIGQAVAGQLNDLTQCKVVLMAGSNVIAYADFSSDSKEKLAEWFRQSPYEPFQADYSSPAKKEVLQGVHYFYRCGRLMSSRNDRTMGYLLLYSNDQQTSELERTQALLLTVNLAAILLGSAVVWFFVRRATGPLHELRVNAEAVGHGDFSRRVAVRSRDECGQLGRVFNQMTENLQESRAELEKTVETLKGTQAQLIQSEKLSGVGEFVAGVAHELNNPLAAVMGFSELLKDSNTDERQGRHLDIIYKSSQRCQKIVQSLLSFARRHQPERKPVQVNKLIEAVLEIINYQLRTGNIKVTLQLDPNLPMVEGDEHQLQQVLLNVINNARQAIDLNKPGGWIKIVTEVSEPNVRILIHDSGPGIPEENLTRIFDPFFTTKDVGKGTGLGLSLCYGIIKEHGGTITPLNRNGEGPTCSTRACRGRRKSPANSARRCP